MRKIFNAQRFALLSSTHYDRKSFQALFAQDKSLPNKIDFVAKLQVDAFESKTASWGHWGNRRKSYSAWTNHSNRLIPVYTFGGNFQEYSGKNSVYRDEAALEKLYGRLPESTLNPDAEYADQTDVYRMQRAAIESGRKKNVILIVFDGMDWWTTWAAATYAAGQVAYTEGRGQGLSFQDYRGSETDFSYVVTSPHDDGLEGNPDLQNLETNPLKQYGGYDYRLAGSTPWAIPKDIEYPIGRSRVSPHAYTDSSSSATSMTAGAKIFNGSINVTHDLKKLETIAHWVQREKGMSVGAVTSVPICHATPAAAYAHNVSRDDYQDLTRDMLGLKSISHPESPLPGMDVVLGGGWGETTESNKGQGNNFIAGNRYLSDEDFEAATTRLTNRYTAAIRTPGEKVVMSSKSPHKKHCRTARDSSASSGLRKVIYRFALPTAITSRSPMFAKPKFTAKPTSWRIQRCPI